MSKSSFGFENKNNTEIIIKNDAFFPDISLNDFINTWSLPVDSDEELLSEVLQVSILNINNQLREWVYKNIALGFETLADVPSNRVGDTSEFNLMYMKAVSYKAKSEWMGMFSGIGRGDESAELIANRTALKGVYSREVRSALKVFLNNTITDCELL